MNTNVPSARWTRRARLSARAAGRLRTMRPSSSPAPASARSRRGFDAAAAAVPAPPCIAARVFSLGGVSGASMMDPTAEASGAGVGCHTRVTIGPPLGA